MKQQLEQIKSTALAALDAAQTPAALEELRVKLLGKKGELTAVLKQMGKLSPEERPVMGQLANAVTPAALEELRVKLLGKKGELTAVLKQMGKLSPEERPVMGQLANAVRAEIEQKLESRKAQIHAAALEAKLAAERIDVTVPGTQISMGHQHPMNSRKAQIHAAALEAKLAAERIDVTVPGTQISMGHQHPMNMVLQEIKDIFVGMGYQVVDGPEIELADYNFTRLNIEEGHPSRDRSDTFYFTDDDSVLLRTQTSPMQIRAMEISEPPICILAPGRVFRKDEADATHSPMFHQIEGLVVAEDITMGDLKGALVTVMQRIYGQDLQMRFRPHHFPFTEPSCEMDMQCHKCHGTGEVDGQVCSTCHGEGWIELLGAGMVHPEVLSNCGIDPEKYSGFAFGMGLERMAMGRLRINDLRLIFDNDIRFLNQF